MISQSLNESEIKETLNNFLTVIRTIDPTYDNEVKEDHRTKFSISKTYQGVTKKIYFELLDPPSWRYNNDVSCKGFIIYSDPSDYRRHDARKRSKLFVKNLERFNDIIHEEIKNLNDSIQYELNHTVNGCHCQIRYDRQAKYYNHAWRNLLDFLELPYYKVNSHSVHRYETEFNKDKPELYIERNLEALNHYKLNIKIQRLQAHDVTTIINIILNHIKELREFRVSSNSSFDYSLDIKEINRDLLKQIINVIKTRLEFKKDET
jgi:hypothetical protein